MYSLVSLSHLLALASNLNILLERIGDSGQACLTSDFRWIALNLFPFNMIFAMTLSYIAFIILRYGPYNPVLFRTFVMNSCWILSKAFLFSFFLFLNFFLRVCVSKT